MAIDKLRLILGDQLNVNHSWFETSDDTVLYVLMEIRPESEYVKHHIQKIAGIFQAMRIFAGACILREAKDRNQSRQL